VNSTNPYTNSIRESNLEQMFDNTKSEKITFRSLCKQILQAHKSIRFAGVANKFGTKIASEYRKDLVPLLTESQLELSTIESVIRMNTRIWEKDVESRLGRPIYSCTLYEKIKRVTFLLDDEDFPILIVSLDREEEGGASVIQESVALDKILSIVKEQNISPRLNGGLAL
jgi:hypothetical protein